MKFLTLLFLTISLTSGQMAFAQSELIPANVDTTTPPDINLGVLGARVSVDADQRDERHPRSFSNSAEVKFIFENSLADERLEVGDVIVGVNKGKFSGNFTSKISQAIGKAEAGNGKLDLMIERNGKSMNVAFTLRKMGKYGRNWPYDCEKSKLILQDACDWLVKHQLPSGRLEPKEGSLDFVLTSVGGIAMLGCDPQRYKQPLAKMASFIEGHLNKKLDADGRYTTKYNLELWSLNYAAIFLSEYYLSTSDEKLMPTLELLNREISRRQFHIAKKDKAVEKHVVELRERRGDKGDPFPDYWFSHGEVTTKSSGYVHLGVNVANACVAWTLLAKAGANVDLQNLKETKDFIEKACVSGNMGYAAKIGQKGHSSDSFGRTGVLGVALALDNDRRNFTERVRHSLSVLEPVHTYNSHGSPVMGKAWGMIGIANLDPKLFRRTMDSHRDDFELIRLSDGSFVSNPRSANSYLKIDIKGFGHGHRWTTAFNAMIYALGTKTLHIGGANRK